MKTFSNYFGCYYVRHIDIALRQGLVKKKPCNRSSAQTFQNQNTKWLRSQILLNSSQKSTYSRTSWDRLILYKSNFNLLSTKYVLYSAKRSIHLFAQLTSRFQLGRIRTFHSTQRNNMPPIIWVFLRPIANIVAVVAGR